jgi:hypothetical protein
MTTHPHALASPRPVAFGSPSDAPALPLLHPLVRAALRAAELATIEARVRQHGVMRCPTRFAAPTRHAAVIEPVEQRPSDTPLTTVADCARWLREHGHPGFTVVRPDLFYRLGRLLSADALRRAVRRLQARQLRGADVARDPARAPPSRQGRDSGHLPGPSVAAGLSFR